MKRENKNYQELCKKLKESNDRLELFFTQSLDGFFYMMLDEPIEWDENVNKDAIIDYVFSHQRMTKVNEALVKQYGATKDQLLGLTPNDFFAENLVYGKDLWKKMFDNGNIHIETKEFKFDGTPMWVEGDYICLYNERRQIIGHFGIQREITDRKIIEEELKSERSLYIGGPVVIFKWQPTTGWPIQYISPNIESQWGYRPEEFTTRKIHFADLIHPEDLPRVEEEVNFYTNEQLIFYEQEYRLRHKSGSFRWIKDYTKVVRDDHNNVVNYYGYILDNHDNKLREVRLISSEERWKFALEGSGEGVWDWNLETNEVFFSTQWKKMLGFREDEIHGSLEEWDKRVHPDDKETVYKDINEHLSGVTPVYINEHRVLNKDGNYLWILDRGKVVSYSEDGKPLRMIGTHSDMTERRTIEEELKKSKEEAEAHNKAKTQFLANMSHEIRTPLNAILGITDLLNETKLTEEQKEYIGIFKKSGAQLMTILNSILDLSKIEFGQVAIHHHLFNVEALILETVELFKKDLAEKNIEVHFEICLDENEKYVQGDVEKVRQILVNLISNAVKFTQSGSIHVKLQKKLDYLFAIKDTGIGIHEDHYEKIFEEFNQVDASVTRRYGGSGLGLTISKKLITLLGGEIWLESVNGQGSTFYFTIPLISGKKLSELNEPIEKDLKLLIVEDSEDNRLLLQFYLKGLGWNLDFAENGKIAVDKVKENFYDLILMDIQMPEMDGYEATKQIRQLELREMRVKTPIISLSAHSLNEDKLKSLHVGSDAYLTKPIRKDILIQSIITVLKGGN